MNWHPPSPDPTEAEIAVACERIQRTWSNDERRRRRWGLMPGSRHASSTPPDAHWTAPTIHVGAVVAAVLEVR